MVAWWFSKQLGIAEQEDFDVLENASGGAVHRSAADDTSRSRTSKCALDRFGFYRSRRCVWRLPLHWLFWDALLQVEKRLFLLAQADSVESKLLPAVQVHRKPVPERERI